MLPSRSWLVRYLVQRRAAISAGAVVGIGAVFAWLLLDARLSEWGLRYVGADLTGYLAGARRFIDTGSPYLPEQVAGPWTLFPGSFIHPPTALVLFVPFLWLPHLLWWLVPLGLTMWAIWRLRPRWWTWPLMMLLLCWPRSVGSLLAGNTDMWVLALVAVGAVAHWAAPLVVGLKPSLAPLALIGVRSRSWWIGLGVVAIASIASYPLWAQYIAVIQNAELPLTYSLYNLALPLVAVVAWLGRSREGGRPTRDPTPDLSPPPPR